MSDNSQELALRLMRVKETTIAAKHTAESSETKATKEKKQVLDLQGLLDDVYLLIVKHLTPADLIQLIGSSKHFKQYLDIDFYWTQFCLRALVNSKTGQAKEIFKHFSLLKKEIGLLFPNDMIAVFSSLPTTIPKKNLEDEYDSLLSIEDFSDTSVMVVNRPTERDSYIAMMIENRRLFSNRGAIITCGHLNVKPGDKDPSSSAIMFCHTQMGHLSTTLLVRAIDHRYLDLIRTLVERNKEYRDLNPILHCFFNEIPITELIHEYDGRDGRVLRSNPGILGDGLRALFRGRDIEDDFNEEDIVETSIRIAPLWRP